MKDATPTTSALREAAQAALQALETLAAWPSVRPQAWADAKATEAYLGLRSALAAQQAQVPDALPVAPDKEVLTDLIAGLLSGTYHCTRVWSAWHVGTMSQDDFEPVDEGNTPAEIADAVLALYAGAAPAAQQPAPQPLTDAEIWRVGMKWAKTEGWADFERNDFIGCVRELVAGISTAQVAPDTDTTAAPQQAPTKGST